MLLVEDDSVLNKLRSWGLAAYKMVFYKKVCSYDTNILKKNWSQNSKMVESSRLFSSSKKKSKRSKLAGAAVYWTNFKAEWKKRISFHHKLVKWCWPVGDIIKTAFCINFLCFHQIWSNPATIMDKVFETNPSFHVAHYGKCPIWIFQEFVASTDRFFILGGRLGTRL